MRMHGVLALATASTLLVAGPVSAQTTEVVCGRTFVTVDSTLYQLSRESLYEVIPGQVCVRFSSSTTAAEIDSVAEMLSSHVARTYQSGLRVLAFDESTDPLDILRSYCGSPFVEIAGLSTVARFTSSPNDTYYDSRQWDMKPSHMDLQSAWDVAVGDTSIVVGVLDSGIYRAHEDLSGRTWINLHEHPDCGGQESVDDDPNGGNGYIDDIYGWNFHTDSNDVAADADVHGTAVAGIIGAITNNSTGVAGIAGGWSSTTPGETVKGCKPMQVVLTANDDDAAFASAIRYAADNGASVINMSWTKAESDFVRNAIKYAADTLDVLCVAASGNVAAGPVQWPASMDNVIAVGATWKDDKFASNYSAWGADQTVVAPSAPCVRQPEIASPDECRGEYGNYVYTTHDSTGYDEFSGTSCAAPHVSGLAALIISAYPELSSEEVRDAIEASAEDLVGDDTTAGWDSLYGYGRVNAYAALLLAAGGGTISSDTRLCHDVEFDRDVKVSEGTTLTVLPGVTIEFAAGSDAANLGIDSSRCELIVEGTLIAEGLNASTPVTFTSSGSSEETGSAFGPSATHQGATYN